LAGPEIAELAGRGDADCGATLGRYADRLARGLAAVINLIDPDAIVLGGGVSGIASSHQSRSVVATYFLDHVVTRLLSRFMGIERGPGRLLWRPNEEW
jgi:predicted NBD/HSP70 family sugar kinase